MAISLISSENNAKGQKMKNIENGKIVKGIGH